MARTLTIVAVGLIVLGAMMMAGPTFGFSTMAGDRGVDVNVAADQMQAFLGIDDQTAGGITIDENDQSPDEVLRLIDNGVGIESADDIDISLVDFAGEASVEIFSVSETEDGFSVAVVADCDEGASNEENGALTFDIDADGDAQVSTTYETESITVTCADDEDKVVDDDEETDGGDVSTGGNLTVESGGNDLNTGGGNITVGNNMGLEGGGTSVYTEGGSIVVGGDLTLGNGINEINSGGGDIYIGGDLIMGSNSNINTEGGDLIIEGCIDSYPNSDINTNGGTLMGDSC